MTKTALAWLGVYGSSLILTWIDPIYGLMGVMSEYYKRPGLQWWGNDLPRGRWSGRSIGPRSAY